MPAPNPALSSAKLLVGLSFLLALGNVVLAFAPGGFGFLTVFVAAVGVMMGGTAAKYGMERAGLWASRSNSIGVLVYIVYMVTFMPTQIAMYEYWATVTETGVLEDQSVFSKKVQSAGPVQGIRMRVAPCENEWVIRTTGKPIAQIGTYVPTKTTRECLSRIKVGERVDMSIRVEIRTLTGSPKAFQLLAVGPCTFEETDVGAVVKADACSTWF
jgi:hypothetical protein